MVTFTNKHGLPDPLFQLLGRESYSRGASRRSATQLIDSPRLVALKEKHGQSDTIEVDISERIWALFGSAVHKLIEDGLPHSNWTMAEERIFSEVNGWVISGAVDLQAFDDAPEDQENQVNLIDWKTCSVWSLKRDKHGNPKREWVHQLNLLAYLVETEKPGVKVNKLQIGALIRDWRRADADRDPSYPQAPFVMVDIPLWDYDLRKAWVEERVRLHQEAEVSLNMGEEPEPCTSEEMWQGDDQWAVFRKGNKRASKVCDNEADAIAFAQTVQDSYIEHRPGKPLRCLSYCEAAAFCVHAPKPDYGF